MRAERGSPSPRAHRSRGPSWLRHRNGPRCAGVWPAGQGCSCCPAACRSKFRQFEARKACFAGAQEFCRQEIFQRFRLQGWIVRRLRCGENLLARGMAFVRRVLGVVGHVAIEADRGIVVAFGKGLVTARQSANDDLAQLAIVGHAILFLDPAEFLVGGHTRLRA